MDWLLPFTSVAAGLTTGALAISVANPTDLVKVRLQAEGKLAAGFVLVTNYCGAIVTLSDSLPVY